MLAKQGGKKRDKGALDVLGYMKIIMNNTNPYIYGAKVDDTIWANIYPGIIILTMIRFHYTYRAILSIITSETRGSHLFDIPRST